MVEYHPNIIIPQPDVDEMYNNNYSLYMMRAVEATSTDQAKPAVWRSYDRSHITHQMDPWWTETYNLYTRPKVVPEVGQGIDNYTPYTKLNLKDLLRIFRENATGDIYSGQAPDGSLTVDNEVRESKFSCGLCTLDEAGEVKPYNAFPSNGISAITFTPIVKFIAFFATETINEGTVLVTTNTGGAIIDFTGSKVTKHIANFSLGDGWSPDKTDPGNWLTPIPAGDVTKYLIVRTNAG
ncbi:hypothetical protein [Saccharopolyspora taberi]|uniref:Uncharacterized protein n=1 Tax=Saccharopolyspora taberi TaxID=60895 RepID=A0ABN3V6M3_9PSEU